MPTTRSRSLALQADGKVVVGVFSNLLATSRAQ